MGRAWYDDREEGVIPCAQEAKWRGSKARASEAGLNREWMGGKWCRGDPEG